MSILSNLRCLDYLLYLFIQFSQLILHCHPIKIILLFFLHRLFDYFTQPNFHFLQPHRFVLRLVMVHRLVYLPFLFDVRIQQFCFSFWRLRWRLQWYRVQNFMCSRITWILFQVFQHQGLVLGGTLFSGKCKVF